jgi:hypothetical protein
LDSVKIITRFKVYESFSKNPAPGAAAIKRQPETQFPEAAAGFLRKSTEKSRRSPSIYRRKQQWVGGDAARIGLFPKRKQPLSMSGWNGERKSPMLGDLLISNSFIRIGNEGRAHQAPPCRDGDRAAIPFGRNGQTVCN